MIASNALLTNTLDLLLLYHQRARLSFLVSPVSRSFSAAKVCKLLTNIGMNMTVI